MSYITKLLRGADEQRTDEMETPRSPAEIEIERKELFRQMQQTRPQEPAPMIVRVAETYLKAHDNYTAAERDLTHRIDALVEERRQMRAAISSAQSGLYPISEDPALPDEMKKRIAATLNNAVRVTIDDADLT